MANRWGNNEKSDRLYLGGSKITADGDCSHEIIRCLLLGRIAMTNLDSILKIRDITLPTKVHLVKAMFFQYHVWMWELDYKESWVPKNWCFWNVVLRRLLRVPWAARRSNQSLLKEISPEYSLKDCYWSWNFITLATWCKELTYWKRPWCWERSKAWGEGYDRLRWLNGITHLMDTSLSKLQEFVMDRESWHPAFHEVTKRDTNELIWNKIWNIFYIVILPIFIQLFHRDVSSEFKLPSILLASYVILTNLYFVINFSLNESISIYLIKLC